MKTKRYSLPLKTILSLSLLLGTSISANAQVPQLSGYCPNNPTPGVPTFNQVCGHATFYSYIRSVETVGGMVNFSNLNTNCGNTTTSFSDYTGTNMLVKQDAGKTVDVKVTWVGNTSVNPGPTMGRSLARIFVDWNRDGDFDDQDEYATPPPNPVPNPRPDVHQSSNSTITLKITVPGHAKEGLTRMRIITSANIQQTQGASNQCSGIYGEAEDYSFEVVNPCLPPNVISIANKDYKSADFSWTPKLNAEFYEYVITPVDTIPHDTVSGFTFTKNTNVDVDTFECNTQYYVMVRVVCDTAGKIARDWKRSAWVRDSFTTEPCCYAPKLTVDKLSHSTVRVQWDPIQTAYGYEYAISTTPEPPQKGHYTISTAIVQQGLSPKTTYFFHVRSRCTPTPLSDWSKESFKTLAGVSVENVHGGASFSMEAYPNPMLDNLTVQLNGNIGGNARLAILDLTGKTLYNTSVNSDKVVIDASNLPSGIYIVKYNDDTHNEIMRVTKK
ncbi:MAG: T9SS type A sorting domain-containing protein [Taibaiella sp.]|nr:T9SS type A sorting domain-containing protein [Taibaiella sp.]